MPLDIVSMAIYVTLEGKIPRTPNTVALQQPILKELPCLHSSPSPIIGFISLYFAFEYK